MSWLSLKKKLAFDRESKATVLTYQQTLRFEQHTEVPGRVAVGLGLINDNSIEQTLAAHGLDDGALDGLQTIAEDVTELLSALDHVLLLDDFQGSDSDCAGQRVTSIGRTMSARLDSKHHIFAAQHAGHGVHATGDGLAQQHHVRLDAAPLVAEQLAGAGNTGLNLIADQQDVVLVAQGSGLLQVILVGDNNACLALNGLHQEGGEVGTRLLEGLPQGGLIVVGDRLVRSGNGAADTGQVRAIVLARLGVRR